MEGAQRGIVFGAVIALVMPSLAGCSDDGGGSTATGGSGGGGTGGLDTGGSGGQAAAASGGSGATTGGSGGASVATPTPSGGEIREGRCYPPEPPTSREDLGDAVEVLDDTDGIYVGPATYPGGVVYGIDRDGLYHIPAGSSAREQIAATPDHRYIPWVLGDHLYYRITSSASGEPTPVERLPLSDLSATPERVLDDMPDYSALSESYLYLYDRGGTGNITRVPLGGGPVDGGADGGAGELVAESTYGDVRVFGDGYVYFVRSPFDDQIWRIPEAGGEAEMIVGDTFDIGSYVVTDTGVFVSSYYSLSFTPFGDPESRTVFRANSTGLGSGTDHYVVGVTDARLYWVLMDFPSGILGWTALDHSDCDYVVDAGWDYHSAALGPDGVYVTTFGTDDELYRVGL